MSGSFDISTSTTNRFNSMSEDSSKTDYLTDILRYDADFSGSSDRYLETVVILMMQNLDICFGKRDSH